MTINLLDQRHHHMAELLKHIYNTSFFDTYTDALTEVIPTFDKSTFIVSFQTAHWDSLELKQRMAFLAHSTAKILPMEYPEKVKTILRLIDVLRRRGVKDQNLEYIFLADIITEYGLDDLKTSVAAIEAITQFVSFEFAGRAFIVRYPKEMMRQMVRWTEHHNESVRRYASEGCRPRLPWGTKLTALVHDPSPCIPVLEKLIEDASLYVRKSVANHLNDISKDHPDMVVAYIKKWKGRSANTDWILRHGARTLLKNGNHEVLHIFGTSRDVPYDMEHFQIDQNHLSQSESLSFSFSLTNLSDDEAVFRVEYNIWYVKSGGQFSKKIFKITEKPILPNSTHKFTKLHRFQDLTTRRHYSGIHKISIVINGNESESLAFELRI